MKYCPTCQRNFPDLISLCPTDQTILTEPPTAPRLVSADGAAAAPAKQPPDTRTLEEKLFAPLPNRAAPPASQPTPAVPAPKLAAPPVAPSVAKGSETVFEDAPQKSRKMAAVTATGDDVPWNKIVPAVLAVVVLVAAFFIFHKSAPPPAAADPNPTSSKDVDLELSLRDALGQNAALRNQNIDVRVKDGTVILTGEASSAAKIEQAVKAAKALPGVREVVNHMQVNPSVGVRTQGHAFSAGGLQSGDQGGSTQRGLAEQAKAHELTAAGDRAMSHADYKSAASFYKQALTLNPDDSAASLGYTQAMEKLQ